MHPSPRAHRRVGLRTAKASGQAMVEYGVIAAALVVGLALAIKGVQLALSRQIDHHHQALSKAP